jgi:general secretion pathway protein M
MNWFRSHQRSAWIIGLSLLFPVLIYLYFLLSLWGLRLDYQADVERLQPRMARLLGLIDHQQQLQDSSSKVDRQMSGLVYSAADDSATVSATLQSNVRQILVDAGLSVTNSQVLPVTSKEGFDYVHLRLTVAGDITSLDAALAGITGYLPLLLVESLDVSPARGRKNDKQQLLTATLQVLSLRATQ